MRDKAHRRPRHWRRCVWLLAEGLAAVLLLGAPAFVGDSARQTRALPGCRAVVLVRKAAEEDNVALVFIKPHANTPAALAAVPRFLQDHGVVVERQGSVTAKEILEKGIIDAHYASIAKVGMARDMTALGLSTSAAEKFQAAYGKSIADATAAGQLHSAATALEALHVTPGELLSRCLAAGYEKIASGLYVARLEGPDAQPAYVLNGFYARMREKFVVPGVVVHWFVVRFSPKGMPWKTFRSDIVGATNPKDAAAGSLRAKFRDEWQALGLREETNYQDNAVHSSAGPLEALRERVIWLGEDPIADPFGAALASRGLSDQLYRLVDNPAIKLADGREGRAFDLLEDVDTSEALALLAACAIAA